MTLSLTLQTHCERKHRDAVAMISLAGCFKVSTIVVPGFDAIP